MGLVQRPSRPCTEHFAVGGLQSDADPNRLLECISEEAETAAHRTERAVGLILEQPVVVVPRPGIARKSDFLVRRQRSGDDAG